MSESDDDNYLLVGDYAVSLVKHYDGLECEVCDRSYGDAYTSSVDKFTVHRKCAYVFYMQRMANFPSHERHRIKLLITGAPDHTDSKCHICGKNTKRFVFHCFTCKVNFDIDCMIDNIRAQSHLNMPWHHHPLLLVEFDLDNLECDVRCSAYGHGYFCALCRLVVHENCVSVFDSPEISHHSHGRHPLKLITSGAPDYTDQRCHICGDHVDNLLYHCDICKFNLDLRCAIQNPLTLSNLKVHEHTLTLMPRLISFVCDACGTKGDRSPYICVQCDFMIFHQKCAQLPRVINVNHHDHRVSYKYPLGHGEWRCGVCWEEIDWSYGAYSCSLCPNYAIHSLCGTRKDVWDGEELDGVPEEVEDIAPYKRNDDNTITHFAHEHNLMSLSKDGEETSFCGLCVRPIDSCTFYKCSESDCCFILHETCANLPKMKRHFLSNKPLTLDNSSNYWLGNEGCGACLQTCCDGFFYNHFDLLCSSIGVPFIHGSHPHPLFYLSQKSGNPKTCQNCGSDYRRPVMGCVECNYFLDFHCATLLLTVRLPRYDDHPLILCYGDENASGKYWCDICERETNPETWFYTCKDCGVTLHIFCVLGDVIYAKPGAKIDETSELIPNNRSTRPLCKTCHCRCPCPFIIKFDEIDIFCSSYCASLVPDFPYVDVGGDTIPPWIPKLGGRRLLMN